MGVIQQALKRLFPSRPAGDSDQRHAAGRWGEEQAARFLQGKGYRLLGRRVRVGRRDEFDLVARAEDALVFIEVKTRAREDFGRPADAVNRKKRQVLSRAAVRYLKAIKSPAVCFRFDVVEIIGAQGGPPPRIRHLENAWPLDRRYRVP